MNINEDKFEITKNLLVGVLALSFILGLKKMKTKLEKKKEQITCTFQTIKNKLASSKLR